MERKLAVGKVLSDAALDERLAIVGTSGSGKTYAAKGGVERLLDIGARVCIVDPLGVWWGLRSAADGAAPGYPVVVFDGRHCDVALDDGMGTAVGRLIGGRSLACVLDLSELGSAAARRRFMTDFAEALYEANTDPLHLVLDEADMWAPQRPLPAALTLLGRIEEIVRRGRVRGFIPWLITQRPAVVHKDVLSQADILIAMKLTSSQDRDAIGGWIEGQADRADGKRILADLPKLTRGEGYVWAPTDGMLERATFPVIRTFDSSRTPKRGERIATPSALAPVSLADIMAVLAADQTGPPVAGGPEPSRGQWRVVGDDGGRQRVAELERQLEAACTRIAVLESEEADLRSRLQQVALIVASHADASRLRGPAQEAQSAAMPAAKQPTKHRSPAASRANGRGDGTLHPAARKLLAALAQHAPTRFTWGQVATLAGLKPSGGHYNAGRKQLRDLSLIDEAADLVFASVAGMEAAGEVPPAPSSIEERLDLWCSRLPSPAPDMLRTLAVRGDLYLDTEELASLLGKKPTGGHWNSGIALLRNNGLVELSGKQLRISELFR